MSLITKARRSLSITTLEDRTVPASAVFSAGTLTIVADNNETVTVAPGTGGGVGSVTVSDGGATPVFTGQGVKNIVVRFDSVSQGTLELETGLAVGGNVRVFGASSATSVDVAQDVSVGRGFYFRGLGAANDSLNFAGDLALGRADLRLGDGNNSVTFDGGTIAKRLLVTAGDGDDTFAVNGSLSVGKGLHLNMGHGTNSATVGFDLDPVTIGKSFKYTGGDGVDTVSLGAVTIGRNMQVRLGNGANQSLNVGDGTPTVVGGQLQNPPVTVGRHVLVRGGDGADTINLDYLTARGRIVVKAGAGDDQVSITQSEVTRKTTIRLGEGQDTLLVDGQPSQQGTGLLGGLGLPLVVIENLLTIIRTTAVDAIALGDFISVIEGLGLTTAQILSLVDCLLPLDLGALDTGSFLDRFTSPAHLDLIDRLVGFGLSTVEIDELLDLSLAGNILGLTLNLNLLLSGQPLAIINGLLADLTGNDFRSLLTEADGFGLDVGIVRTLLTTLSGLGLGDLELSQLITCLTSLDVTSGVLCGILTQVTTVVEQIVSLVGIDLGFICGVISFSSLGGDSQVQKFRVYGGKGADTVTLGGAGGGTEYTGRVVLKGGEGTDTLDDRGNNDYRASNNKEDFEVGNMA